MRRRPNIEILLTPSRIEVVSPRTSGACTGVASPLDPARWDQAWKENLQPLDDALKDALRRREATGGDARVFYRSPTAVADVFVAPGAGRNAAAAAALALAESAPFPLDTNPHAVHPVHTWKTPAGRRTLSLILADADDTARSIFAWVERAGCHVERAVPLEAGFTLATLNDITELASDSTVIILRVGEYGSTLAAATGKGIDFIRPVQIDVELLADALSRPIHRRDHPDADPVTLTIDEARSLLFSAGIPAPKDTIDEERGIKGYDVLPTLQPALQRCTVEARQSLRFALSEEQRSGATFALVGPGNAIPRLQEILASHLGLPESAAARDTGWDPFSVGHELGDLMTIGRAIPPPVGLVPVETRAHRRRTALRNAVAAGTAVAVLTAGGAAWFTWQSLTDARNELSRLDEEVGEYEIARDEIESSERRLNALRTVEYEIALSLGEPPQWDGALRELARLTPTTVRITLVEAEHDPAGACTVKITGYVTADEDGEMLDVTEYVASLEQSTLVQEVTLGATHRTSLDGRLSQHFMLAITLLGSPPVIARAQETAP